MTKKKAPSVILGAAGGMLAVSIALTAAYVLDMRKAGAASVQPGERQGSASEEPGVEREAVVAAAEAFLEEDVEIRFDERVEALSWRELGLVVDRDAAEREARRFAKRGEKPDSDVYRDPEGSAGVGVPVALDRERAMESLFALKERLDRAPRSARLDLEGRRVVSEQPGWGIDVYSSMSALELAARSAAPSVDLDGVELAPSRTVEDLGIEDISEVMGRFSTNFRPHQKRRNSNLKLAASQINGYVLEPGEEFSFNDVLGERTKDAGYKIAPVISQGQFADGIAGGICQISSTLHSAVFFAGLEIERALPHSRPIGYIPMGLDATVVYPYVDVVFRNSYDFPVALHYKVAGGEAVVEVLGEGRPYDKIQFVRQIQEEIPFESVTREDSELPVGTMTVDQHGYLGYDAKRYRNYIKDGKVVKRDRWDIQYRPVTEYVRVGVNPDPNLEAPEQSEPRNPNPPRARRQVLEQ